MFPERRMYNGRIWQAGGIIRAMNELIKNIKYYSVYIVKFRRKKNSESNVR